MGTLNVNLRSHRYVPPFKCEPYIPPLCLCSISHDQKLYQNFQNFIYLLIYFFLHFVAGLKLFACFAVEILGQKVGLRKSNNIVYMLRTQN